MGEYRDKYADIIVMLTEMRDRTRRDGLPHMTAESALRAILELVEELDWRQEIHGSLPPFWREIPDPPAIAKAREEEKSAFIWFLRAHGREDLVEAIERDEHHPPIGIARAPEAWANG